MEIHKNTSSEKEVKEQLAAIHSDNIKKLLEENPKRQHDLRVLASGLITSEQGLVNNRMTWMMTFQGLLFATFALTASNNNDPQIKGIIVKAIQIIGTSIAVVALLGIYAAFASITNIKISLKEKVAVLGFDLGYGLEPYGTKLASNLGRIAAYSFPTIIASTWVYIYLETRNIQIINTMEDKKVTIKQSASKSFVDSSKFVHTIREHSNQKIIP